MSGNTFGEHFRLTTFGESHGASVGGVIDGCPAGVTIDFAQIDAELARRRGDGVEGTTERKECDHIEWQSGIIDGVTLGTPIAFLVRNGEARSDDYDNLKDWQRAGHADYTYQEKYGLRDHRGGGRASARETVARVVAGAIAKQLLAAEGISITSEWSSVGGQNVQSKQDNQIPTNQQCDTVGGTVRCTVFGIKPGVGNPVFDRLNARLAYAMMTIPSAVSFEMGAGKAATTMSGKDYADRWNYCEQPVSNPNSQLHNFTTPPLTLTNHCGGIQGGISNGMPLEFTVGFHPVVTQIPLTQCRNRVGEVRMVEVKGRHDRCHVPRAAVVVEAMAALTLIDMINNSETLNP